MSLLRLVNKASLDKILQAEVYVNELDGQLRAVHLILGYNPISYAFQAPTCVIRARDPRLHRISVAYEGFLVPQGIPLPRYSPLTEPLPVATFAAGVTSPPPLVFQVEEEEEAEQEEKGFVDLIVSTDDYEVFNQPHHHKTCLKIWVFKGNPSIVSKNCWKASQEGEKLGSLLSPSFLLLHLNLLLALLSHLHPLG